MTDKKPDLNEYSVPVQPVADLVSRLYATAQHYADKQDPVATAIRTLSLEIGVTLAEMIPPGAIKLLEGYDPSMDEDVTSTNTNVN